MKRLLGLACVVVLAGCASVGETPVASQWVGVWGASPTPPMANAKTFENQTVRQVLRLSAAGSKVRVRLTNEYSDKPLEIGAATVSLAAANGAPVETPTAMSKRGRGIPPFCAACDQPFRKPIPNPPQGPPADKARTLTSSRTSAVVAAVSSGPTS